MRQLDADDVRVYKAWHRRTAAIYAGLVLFGAVVIATISVTKVPTASTYLAAAITLASP